GREYGHRSELNLSLESSRRAFDHREQLDEDGFPIADTSLSFQRETFQFLQRHYWDEKRRWRTTTKLFFELDADNGSGYFDHKKYQISEQLRYRASPWEITAQAKFNYYDFSVQTASEPEFARPADRTPRNRTGIALGLRAERN